MSMRDLAMARDLGVRVCRALGVDVDSQTVTSLTLRFEYGRFVTAEVSYVVPNDVGDDLVAVLRDYTIVERDDGR